MDSVTGGWVTTRVVADRLRVTQQRVLQMIYSEEISAVRMGGIWVIPARELNLQVEARKELSAKDARYVSPN